MTDRLSDLLSQRFGEIPAVPEGIEDNAVLTSLAGHRSYRRFEDRAVAPALLDSLLACAFSAPAKSDLQQSSVIKVTDPARREAIHAMLADAPWVARAPVLLVWCGNNRRIRQICAGKDIAFANDHLDSFFNATVDTALVMMTFIHAARGAGLGCCPLSVIRNHARAVSELLELPEHTFPVAGMVAGWPGEERRVVPRLPLGAFVHENRFDDSGLAADVQSYDRRRDAVLPIAPDRQREPSRFGQAAFYGWSDDKARQVANRERGEFGRYVREQAFELD